MDVFATEPPPPGHPLLQHPRVLAELLPPLTPQLELVLLALCGCTSVDVVSILRKKREPLTSLTVSAVAEQAEEAPRVFTHIQLTYHIGGGVSSKAAEDAVALSKNKYCSVSKMLEKAAKIDYVITYGEGT